jgi:hypothetical protein
MVSPRKTSRALVVIGLAIGLVVVACGGSSSSSNPAGSSGAVGSLGVVGSSLVPGLGANLDKLDSYRFTESDGGLPFSGTIINKPTKAMWIDEGATQTIAIGTKTWSSFDGGNTWYTSGSSSQVDDVPSHYYAFWFDAHSTGFKSVGDESKNGVQCVHFQSGVSDLWIAKDGDFPVSGVSAYAAAVSGHAPLVSFSFDITHVNDPSNKVAPPTNVVSASL